MKAEIDPTRTNKPVRYWRLTDALKNRRIKKTQLAYELGLSCAAIAQRFSGQTQWRLDEIYKILSIIGESEKKMYIYFPNTGTERN